MIFYWKHYLAKVPLMRLITQAEANFRIAMSSLINSKSIFIFFGPNFKLVKREFFCYYF